MQPSLTYTEDEIARVVGYARVKDVKDVKDARSGRRGRKVKLPRGRAALSRLRLGAGSPRIAFA